MKIVVTGGAGYIGSHTVVELVGAGHTVTVIDNFSNSSPCAIERVAGIVGREIDWARVDLLDPDATSGVFRRDRYDAVIHFAGLKAVGESVSAPLWYYENNIVGTLNLLKAMSGAGCQTIVFSSSATVYGDPESLPISEDSPIRPTNPYGHTKAMIEQILRDQAVSEPEWRIALLRYFNPAGAHPSGRIGENPLGKPNNLLPFIAQLSVGRQKELSIWGDDYPTRDGTGVRDYIHVVDLAKGHVAALDYLSGHKGLITCNLGTGRGYSVREVLGAFERACGKKLPATVRPRRPGDIAECYADPTRAKSLLGWAAERDLDAMCVDTWKWQSENPAGYPA